MNCRKNKKNAAAVFTAAVLLMIISGCTPPNGPPAGSSSPAESGTPSPITSQAPSPGTVSASPSPPVSVSPSPEPAELLLSQMSLEEKVGQLFIVTLAALGEDYAGIAAYHPGGVIFFAEDAQNDAQVSSLIASLQSKSALPLFISVDEEGGQVSRLGKNPDISVTRFDSMSDIGATGDTANALAVGQTLGRELGALGFNLDFAPVADLTPLSGPGVMGTRTFSSDPEVAAAMVAQEVIGLQSQNVCAAVKHFPGHGGTSQDSHDGFAVVRQTLEELGTREFLPFMRGVGAGADFVMVGHLLTPEITNDGRPASLSPEMITDVLRGQLGFNGIVITDALNMGAIVDYYGAGEAAVDAVLAGADMLLMPDDLDAAYLAVLQAVQDNTISRTRLDASLRRILRIKALRQII